MMGGIDTTIVATALRTIAEDAAKSLCFDLDEIGHDRPATDPFIELAVYGAMPLSQHQLTARFGESDLDRC